MPTPEIPRFLSKTGDSENCPQRQKNESVSISKSCFVNKAAHQDFVMGVLRMQNTNHEMKGCADS